MINLFNNCKTYLLSTLESSSPVAESPGDDVVSPESVVPESLSPGETELVSSPPDVSSLELSPPEESPLSPEGAFLLDGPPPFGALVEPVD